MKNWFFLAKMLFGALIDSIRSGRGYVLVPEEAWLRQQTERNLMKYERDLIWDCVDHMIADGAACDYCQFAEGCPGRIHGEPSMVPKGCNKWCIRDLTDEEVRNCEPKAKESGCEGDSGLQAGNAGAEAGEAV